MSNRMAVSAYNTLCLINPLNISGLQRLAPRDVLLCPTDTCPFLLLIPGTHTRIDRLFFALFTVPLHVLLVADLVVLQRQSAATALLIRLSTSFFSSTDRRSILTWNWRPPWSPLRRLITVTSKMSPSWCSARCVNFHCTVPLVGAHCVSDVCRKKLQEMLWSSTWTKQRAARTTHTLVARLC